jgi:hypothetical protein
MKKLINRIMNGNYAGVIIWRRATSQVATRDITPEPVDGVE